MKKLFSATNAHKFTRMSVFVFICVYSSLIPSALAQKPAILKNVGIVQKMNAQVPVDVPFVDETGKQVTLSQYLGKPVILALVYYQCPSLCNLVLNGIVRTTKLLTMTAGSDFDVVAISFDPRETPEIAAAKKQTYVKQYGRAGAENGWHFLTGTEASSRMVADAVGFHYAFDSMTNQYAHASAIILLTPQGRVARYFYGVEYPARDLRLGLTEASSGQISSPVDQILLYCYHYDPATGKYGLVVMNLLRAGGILTILCLAGLLFILMRHNGPRDPRGHEQRGAA
jgi:protein SCO1